MAAGRRRRQAARLPVVTPSLTRSPAVSNPTEVIAARLSDLLDSIKCRPVLARLKAQGYSEQVAQVDAAWAGQGVNANPAAMAWRGPIMPLLFFFFSARLPRGARRQAPGVVRIRAQVHQAPRRCVT